MILILNIIYKTRNCFADHKLMLELGWICLSELDDSLAAMRPNYSKILQIMQNALNYERNNMTYEETDDEEVQKYMKRENEVKVLRDRVIELQKRLIEISREKAAIKRSITFKDLKVSTGRRVGRPRKVLPQIIRDESDEINVTQKTLSAVRRGG